MKWRWFSIFLFIFAYHNTFAQQNIALYLQKKNDSLLLEVDQHKAEDSLKLSSYYQLYRNYIRLGETQQVEKYVGKAVRLAQKINQPKLVADGHFWLGFYYHGSNDYLKAEEAYKKSIAKFDELKDKNGTARIYLNLSALYVNIPDYVKALGANLKAVDLFNEIKAEQSVAACYVNIASVYGDLKQHIKAIAYLEKAVNIFLKGKDTDYGIALCYAKLGEVYFNMSNAELQKNTLQEGAQYRKSLEYLSKSLNYAEKTDYGASLLGNIYQTKANIYNTTASKALAQDYYLKSISANRKLQGQGDLGISLLSLANFYIGEAEYEKAKTLLVEVLSIGETLKALKLQRDANLALSYMAEKQGSYVSALAYYKEFILFKEQIFNEEKEKEVTRKQLRLDFSIKERDYQNKQQLTDLALDKQVLLVRERQQQLLLKQQQLSLSDKERNIQRLSFLQKQAILEQEKLQKENQLTQQKLISNLEKEQARQQSLNQESKIKLNRNFSIFFGVLAVGLLAVAIYVYKIQIKTAKLNRLVSAQKQELENLSKVKDQIFSVVSHDMRTPVNSLISFINLLEMGNVSEDKLKKYAASLKNSLGYTSVMMENLLNWAYSQLNGFSPSLQSFELNKVVENLVTTAKVEAGQKNIEISYSGIADLVVINDVNMISLVIRNLLNNAIKFTENGGYISVNLTKEETLMSLEIADTGTGMSDELIHSFNNATTPLGRTTLGTNKEKGTGLGLTMCKTFAQMMNTELSVKSNIPKGTIFTFSIPTS